MEFRELGIRLRFFAFELGGWGSGISIGSLQGMYPDRQEFYEFMGMYGERKEYPGLLVHIERH